MHAVRAVGADPAVHADDEDDWRTTSHAPGMCAMQGVCGQRKDGDPLNCARNVAASRPSPELGAALQATCPSLWAQEGGEQGQYCCTLEQVNNIGISVS